MYTEIYKECQVKMSDSQDSSPIPPKSLFYKKCAKIEKKVLKYLSSYSIIQQCIPAENCSVQYHP